MRLILAALAFALALCSLGAQDSTDADAGPDFSHLLADLNAMDTPGQIPVGDPALGPTPFWPAYPVHVAPRVDSVPLPDPLTDLTTVRENAVTLSPQLGVDDEDLLEMSWVVNVNTSPLEVLARVPLLDPIRAEAIVDHRGANGPFERPHDIVEVFGVTEPMFDVLQNRLICDGESTLSVLQHSDAPSPGRP